MAEKMKYTLQIDAEISALQRKLSAVQQSMGKAFDTSKMGKANTGFDHIAKQLEALRAKAQEPMDAAGFKALLKELAKITAGSKTLEDEFERIKNLTNDNKFSLLPPGEKKKITDAVKAMEEYQKTVEDTQKRTKELTEAEKKLTDVKSKQADYQAKIDEARRKKQSASGEAAAMPGKVKSATGLNVRNADQLKVEEDRIKKAMEAAAKERDRQEKIYQDNGWGTKRPNAKTTDSGEQVDLKTAREAATALQVQYENVQKLRQEWSNTNAIIKAADKTIQTNTNSMAANASAIDAAQEEVNQLTRQWQNMGQAQKQAGFEKLRQDAEKLGVSLEGIGTDASAENLELLSTRMSALGDNAIANLNTSTDTLKANLQSLCEDEQQLGTTIEENNNTYDEQNEKLGNVSGIMSRIQQFTGLVGLTNILTSSVRKAISTIFSLDKQMTEMAVVTDLGVGDYWAQLPQYTQRANELGVAIQDVYEASTLYYQQGLKTNEVTAVSAATLRMARIAGLSSEEATNKMTAALRGFNMEVNEINADRVADVYSKLAAITASDVEEISTAMTKTASLASNAGMEFETTAAFLSQIIETTRESAETAGTALKTVIARFQELKKDPNEIGQIDGETIDANKIETALRSVGVALRDEAGQFRDLDDVFLELSSKWDSLDTNTQRYIATIAAGSRQQSRFIAMMSDYSRTQELVEAANNSSGASTQQFNKTLESFETILKRLTNAWNTFILGLVDNKAFKFILTAITDLINGLNQVYSSLGNFAGTGAKIATLVGATTALEKGMKIFNKTFKETGSVLGGVKSVFGSAAQSAKKFGQSILLGGSTKKTTFFSPQNTKEAVAAMDKYKKSLTHLDISQKTHNQLLADENIEQGYIQLSTENVEKAKAGVKLAEDAYCASLNFTTQQEAAAQTLEGLGIASITAHHAVLGGLTDEKYKEIRATMIMNGLSDDEINDRMAKIAAIYAEKGANQKNTEVEQKGILVLLKEGIQKKISAITSFFKAGAQKVETKATEEQTIANTGLLATMWPLLLITLALVAAIVILVLVMAAVQKANAEADMQKAAEYTQACAEAAENAADKYNNLVDALDELATKYDTLQDLTRGTKEWNEAVEDINDSVLELMDTYPELADQIQNVNGVLTLDTKSQAVQNVVDSYEQTKRSAKAAEYAAKISENNTKKRTTGILEYSGLTRIGYRNYGNSTQYMSNLESQRFAQESLNYNLNTESGIQEFVNAMKELYPTMIISTASVKKYKDELQSYGKTLNNLDTQNQAYYTSMRSVASEGIADIYTEEQQNVAFNAISNGVMQKQLDTANAEAKEDSDASYVDDNEGYSEYMKQLYGPDATIDKYGKVTYTDENGEKQEIEGVDARKQYAAKKATDAATKSMELFTTALTEMSSSQSSAISSLFSASDGANATMADLETLVGKSKELWDSSASLQASYGNNYAEFQKYFDTVVATSQAAFDTATRQLTERGFKATFNENMTSSAVKGISDHLTDIIRLSGDEAAQSTLDSINKIYSSVGKTSGDKFISALNGLDWSNIDQLDTLKDSLYQMGIQVNETSLDTLINDIKEYNNAVKNVPWDTLIERAKTFGQLLKDLLSGEQDRSFDEEVYNQLVSANKALTNSFLEMTDGTYYYVGAMENLTQALDEATAATADNTISTLESKKEAAQILSQGMYANSTTSGVNATAASGGMLPRLLNNALTTFRAQGIDTGTLGIDNLGTKTNISDLKAEEIQQIWSDLLALKNTDATGYDLQINEKKAQATGLTYQNKDIIATWNKAYEEMMAGGGSPASTTMNNVLLSKLYQSGVNTEEVDKLGALMSKLSTAQSDLTTAEANYVRGDKATEEALKTAKKNYQDLVDQVTSLSYNLADQASQFDAITAYQTTVDTLKELSESYKNAATEEEQFMYANQMMNELGLTNTAANLEMVTNLVNGNATAMSAYIDSILSDTTKYATEIDTMMQKGLIKFSDGVYTNNTSNVAAYAASTNDEWENEYTWMTRYEKEAELYDAKRQKAQDAYNRAIERQNLTLEESVNLRKEEIETLKQSEQLAREANTRAQNEISSMLQNSDYKKYISYDATTGTLNTTAALDNVSQTWSSEEYDQFTEFLDKLTDLADLVKDTKDTINDIDDSIYELEQQGKDEYLDLAGQLADAEDQRRKDEIEANEKLSSAIGEVADKIVDKMQEQIDADRQARDNVEKENDIQDKQQRLAYLLQDTSMNHQAEILALQEEIANDQQDYQDTLVDQKIDDITDANEKAAEQREKQIAIAQQTYDLWVENSKANAGASSLTSAFSEMEQGKLFTETTVGRALLNTEEFKALSAIEQEDRIKELNTSANQAYAWYAANQTSLSALGISGTTSPYMTGASVETAAQLTSGNTPSIVNNAENVSNNTVNITMDGISLGQVYTDDEVKDIVTRVLEQLSSQMSTNAVGQSANQP